MSRQKTDVEKWLEEETPHKRTALENASRYFDDLDQLTVSIMESIYARESSFGANRRRRNIKGAGGDFQLERETAIR